MLDLLTIFAETRKKLLLIDFRLQLMREVIQNYHTPKATTGPSVLGCKPTRFTARHFPSLVPKQRKEKSSNKCVVCAHANRGPRKRTNSHYFGRNCDVGLCVFSCFEDFCTLIFIFLLRSFLYFQINYSHV